MGIKTLSNERGAANFVFVAIALPVIITILVGVVDIARAPVVRRDALRALMDGALSAERVVYDAGIEAPDKAPQNLLTPLFPAGTNFCLDTGDPASPPPSCVVSGRKHDIRTADLSNELTKAACETTSQYLLSGTGIFQYPRVAVRFAFLSIPVSEVTGEVTTDAGSVYPSTDDCSGAAKYTEFDPDSSKFNAILANLDGKLLGNAVGNRILGQSVKPWIGGTWLIGVAFVEYEHTFPIFGEKAVVEEYFIRPVEVVSGIQNRLTE